MVQFTVQDGGMWNFWTCDYTYDERTELGWDTTLQVFEDGGAGCPTTQTAWENQVVGCDGDGCGNDAYESDLYVALFPGETYYLVLDGWSSSAFGTAWVIFYRAGAFCTSDDTCDNGLGCDGAETCDHQFDPENPAGDGLCVAGPGSPCLLYQTCIPGEAWNEYTCEDPAPCTAYDAGPQDTSSFGPPAVVSAGYVWTEIALCEGCGRELISYDVCISGRGDDEFDVTVQLWTVQPTTDKPGDTMCMPLAPIPGTACTYHQAPDSTGTPCHQYTCTPTADPPVILGDAVSYPQETAPFVDACCGIDVYIGMDVPDYAQNIGPGSCPQFPPVGYNPYFYLDPQFGGRVLMQYYDGSYTFMAWTGGTGLSVQSWANTSICTVEVGACCFDEGGCEYLTEADCTAAEGTFDGINTLPDPHLCNDPDGDGMFNACDNCPDVDNPDQADCNDDGEGDACEENEGEQDADEDGCCNDVDECDDDPLKCEEGQCGCGVQDTDTDGDGTANCNDDCPLDAGKTAPGCCGCGFVDTDVDEDGYPECEPGADVQDIDDCPDTCPNVDDFLYGPCPQDAIPTVSEWGLVIMALLLLVAGKVYFGRRTAIG